MSIYFASSGVRYLIDLGTLPSKREGKRRAALALKVGILQPSTARLAFKRSDYGYDEACFSV